MAIDSRAHLLIERLRGGDKQHAATVTTGARKLERLLALSGAHATDE
jgi:hypothetical protein